MEVKAEVWERFGVLFPEICNLAFSLDAFLFCMLPFDILACRWCVVDLDYWWAGEEGLGFAARGLSRRCNGTTLKTAALGGGGSSNSVSVVFPTPF